MSCADFRPKLDQFLSEELGDCERKEIEVHLQECESCRTELAALRQWKSLIRETGRQFTPSAAFRRKLTAQYATAQPARWRIPTWASVLVTCGALAAMVLIALSYRVTLARKQVFAEIVDQHSAILNTGRSLDITSADDQAVESFFKGKIPFSLRIPELKSTPFSLLGARLVFLHQMPGVQLVFTSPTQQISAFVFLEDAPLRRAFRQHDLVSRRDPFNVEICGKKGIRYLIVGDVDSATVHQLADLMEGPE
jgi:anti-sigma factor RsiW